MLASVRECGEPRVVVQSAQLKMVIQPEVDRKERLWPVRRASCGVCRPQGEPMHEDVDEVEQRRRRPYEFLDSSVQREVLPPVKCVKEARDGDAAVIREP